MSADSAHAQSGNPTIVGIPSGSSRSRQMSSSVIAGGSFSSLSQSITSACHDARCALERSCADQLREVPIHTRNGLIHILDQHDPFLKPGRLTVPTFAAVAMGTRQQAVLALLQPACGLQRLRSDSSHMARDLPGYARSTPHWQRTCLRRA